MRVLFLRPRLNIPIFMPILAENILVIFLDYSTYGTSVFDRMYLVSGWYKSNVRASLQVLEY